MHFIMTFDMMLFISIFIIDVHDDNIDDEDDGDMGVDL